MKILVDDTITVSHCRLRCMDSICLVLTVLAFSESLFPLILYVHANLERAAAGICTALIPVGSNAKPFLLNSCLEIVSRKVNAGPGMESIGVSFLLTAKIGGKDTHFLSIHLGI